ncbi:MAG: hypothetical protein LBT45_03175 [Rickettsiales bacterium]|jgi:hypothetical protein|nr:hypothetical protein [Rickettsiales bacterium]
MNTRWLALIKTHNLTCHICGLVILSAKELTSDHYPIPKSKGGFECLPSHRWCDNAHRDHLDAKNPKYLERLLASWNKNGTLFNWRAYKSVYKLQRDLVAGRRLNVFEIKRSVDFLFSVPQKHRDREWGKNLELFVGLLRDDLERYKKIVRRNKLVR